MRRLIVAVVVVASCAPPRVVEPPIVAPAPSSEPYVPVPVAAPPTTTRGPGSVVTLREDHLVLPTAIVWRVGRGELDPVSEPVLAGVFEYLLRDRDVTKLRIEVHTDSHGAAAMNRLLSEQRALTFARWLVSRGIDCKRLVPVGFGDAKPVAPDTTPEGRALNRRVELVIAERGGDSFGRALEGGGHFAGDPCARPQ